MYESFVIYWVVKASSDQLWIRRSDFENLEFTAKFLYYLWDGAKAVFLKTAFGQSQRWSPIKRYTGCRKKKKDFQIWQIKLFTENLLV